MGFLFNRNIQQAPPVPLPPMLMGHKQPAPEKPCEHVKAELARSFLSKNGRVYMEIWRCAACKRLFVMRVEL